MKLRILAWIVLLVVVAKPALAQQVNAPIGKDQIITLVKAGMGTSELVKLIRAHGIDFDLTDEDVQAFRHAGAEEAVIQALRAARPKPLTADQVMALVAGGVPPDRAAALVAQHGIDFVADDRYLQTLRLAGGDDVLIAAVRKASQAGMGELVVATSPGAAVYLDGELQGRAGGQGELGMKFKPGAHALKVTLKGKTDFQQEVTLAARQTTRVEAQLVDLTPPPEPVRGNPEVPHQVVPPPTAPATATSRIGVLDLDKVLGGTAEGRDALARKDDSAIAKAGQKLVALLSEYARRNDYAYILDAKNSNIYYVAAGVDLTEQVTSVYASSGSLASVAAPASLPPSIAVINYQTAIADTQDGKTAIADLQKKYMPRKQELDRLQQEIQALQDQLSKQGGSLSEEEKQRLSRDLEEKQKLLKQSTEAAQNDFNRDRDEAVNRIAQKMAPVIHDYAQQNGYTMVLDDAQDPVYFAAKNVEITAEVVKCYDAGNVPRATPAGAHGSSETGRAGFINIQQAIANTAEGKKAIADLQKKYLPRQQELERLNKEIKEIQERLTNQAATLSAEERSRLGSALDEKQKLLKRSGEDAQSDFSRDQGEFINRIGQKLVRIISDYAQQNGFAVVMDDAQIPIYYLSPSLDLTKEIISRYDVANPVADAGADPALPGVTLGSHRQAPATLRARRL